MKVTQKWLNQPRTKQVLLAFSFPRTPSQVQKIQGVKKIKVAPLLQKQLIKPLNPQATKGSLYILTDKARQLLHLPEYNKETKTDWDTIGWIMASPRQRHVILKTLSKYPMKRTSEDIRRRATPMNPRLSRISTKETLKELISRNLVQTEKGQDRRRRYWITDQGRTILSAIDLNSLEPCLSNHFSN